MMFEFMGEKYELTLEGLQTSLIDMYVCFDEAQNDVPYARRSEIRKADTRSAEFKKHLAYVRAALTELFKEK